MSEDFKRDTIDFRMEKNMRRIWAGISKSPLRKDTLSRNGSAIFSFVMIVIWRVPILIPACFCLEISGLTLFWTIPIKNTAMLCSANMSANAPSLTLIVSGVSLLSTEI